MRRLITTAIAIVVLAMIAGCGGSDEDPAVKATDECFTYDEGEGKQEGIDECLRALDEAQ